MTITAWLMDDDSSVDQREPHRYPGGAAVSGADLDALGVLRWEGIDGPDDSRLAGGAFP